MEQSPSYPSKAEIVRRKAQQRRLSETLGIELPEIGTESEAPPVDEAEIRGFVEKRMSTDAQRRVAGLIWRFHSWAAAYCTILQWSAEIDPSQIR